MKKRNLIFILSIILSGCNFNGSLNSNINYNSSSIKDNNKNENYKFTLSNDANKAKKIIDETIDGLTNKNDKTIIKKNLNDSSSSMENVSLSTQETNNSIINSSSKFENVNLDNISQLDYFDGEFLYFYYDAGNNEAAIKTSSEPLSEAYGFLESQRLNGNAMTNYMNKYFYHNENECLRINTFEEVDIVSIDYWGSYHMIIGTYNDESYVLSYSYGQKEFEKIEFNYESSSFGLTYWQTNEYWLNEIDDLIELFDAISQLTSMPLRIVKEMYYDGENVKPLSEAYDENNANHVFYERNEMNYLSPWALSSMYFTKKLEYDYRGNVEKYIIEDNVFKGIENMGIPLIVKVPDGVTSIEKFSNELIYAVLLPNSIENISSSLGDNTELQYVFIDSLTKNEDLENQLKLINEDVKIYYQDEWEDNNGLILPIISN